ncbi:MAG TPA: murein biosynthesis integral membrane protein MurJ [Bdellovibrionota bacterium]|jgi:putative peptidoglycan lipid II flippase
MSSKPTPPKTSFYGATLLMASGTFLSRILGLVREQVFAYFFGAGIASDAFQLAFRIPNLLRDLFAEGAMSSALVPAYTQLRHKEGDEAGWQLVSNVATTLAVLLGGIALVGILCSGPLVSVFAPAFSQTPGKHEMAVAMTRILWPFLPLVGLAAVWMGVLNSREKYGVPALAPSCFNLVSIVAAFTLCPLVAHLWKVPAIYGWAAGATLGGLAQWLVQVPALRAEGFRYRWRFVTSDPSLRKMVLLMGAGTFSLAATQVNVFVNSVLASGQGNGAMSWLNYAFRLMQFPIGVFGVAISTANLTKVAREAAMGDLQAVRDSLRDALRMVLVLTVPSSVGLAVLGIPIISVIYQHGRFLPSDTYQTSLALAGYALGLSAYAGIRVMVPVLYSLGRSRSAVWSSGLGMVLNVVLCLSLVGPLGFQGLAVAMSCSSILNALVLLWILQSHLKQIAFKDIGICLAKSLAASLFMAIFVYVFLGFLGATPFHPIPLTGLWDKANFAAHLLYLSAALLLGLSTYGTAGRLLGLQELERLQGTIWKRLRTRRDKA